ncbi:MAG: tRNA (adenosine(37)-N6)-threonylcarbamoyltransferase complex dimerization subunit type 1 TsaB [Alphaproteobacteria bacterium]|nr:tRNA (adenosine(37)-N6)-threonylcarbamoyltransferase complex dimerization subunit type 1 TsaB [Alphaproteobacteria bacterium]
MNDKATYLAFDCTSGDSSVALRVADACYSQTIPAGKQSALLIATIDTLLKQANLAYKDITAIITTTGPGTFTGIRIALAAAHGIHLVTKTPLKTLTTTEAYAWQAGQACDVVLNAGKGELYHQSFDFTDKPVATCDITMIAPSALKLRTSHVVGNILIDHVASMVAPIDAAILCKAAPLLDITPLHEAVPLYIRPPDAKLPEARRTAT